MSMTSEQKRTELQEINKLVKEATGKTYKLETLTVGQYQYVKEITLTEDLRVNEKTIAEFLNDAKGQPDPTRPNADAGKKFWQGTLPVGISVKVKKDLVSNGVLPAGTYKLFVFGADNRPSFAVSDLASYSKVDALYQ